MGKMVRTIRSLVGSQLPGRRRAGTCTARALGAHDPPAGWPGDPVVLFRARGLRWRPRRPMAARVAAPSVSVP